MAVVRAKSSTEKYMLETAAPDGFVVLRRFTYGEVIKRRSLTKMSMDLGSKQKKGEEKKEMQGEMALASTDITAFDFATAVVDHNLELDEGVKINFTNATQLAYLDPAVGEEIEVLIAKLNDFTEEVGE